MSDLQPFQTSDIFIYVPVWLALVAWFAGALARARRHRDSAETLYRVAWLFGGAMIIIHILTSYGLAHGWSHSEAIRATAKESERVTGIRAGWGVYVNFAFAVVWFGYSLVMVIAGRRFHRIDPVIFWFTAAIVFAATVVFETGAVRGMSLAGFVLLAVWSHRRTSSQLSVR